MANLLKHKAKVCLTATGWLCNHGKLLMVHHKKLGVWLSPGGHIDENELPHQAAEREFWEETGVKVAAVSGDEFIHTIESTLRGKNESEYVPNPFCSNLHWVCRENYEVRKGRASADTVPEGWRKRKCEQHLALAYFVQPVGSIKFKQNIEETLGIGWFDKQEVKGLHTLESIRREALYVLDHYPQT